MKKKLAIAAAVVVALILVFVVFVAMQPEEFRVSRSTVIQAPPATPFGLVNDLHNWEGWSPWAKLDPNMTVAYEGPESGVGASYTWAGNDQVGEGRMTITDSKPGELVRIDLEFLVPFESSNVAEFTFAEEGGATKVTWNMYGTNNFIAKLFNVLMDMEGMVGESFETGLASMKQLAEDQKNAVEPEDEAPEQG